ncbi:hypothetical protein Patl1_02696 [Pistacia atlantica]|uniref:Uncharacterized protein n=1 Tax=Pistacia atlantica TaxID=434234 RepID=A0ACC1CBY8_9ROSI|nr:hypothetical protein Patl1_02696 [Pistacia atlantica]
MNRRNFFKEILLFAAMVSLECSYVGLHVTYKAATLKGLSNMSSSSTLTQLPLLFSSLLPSSLNLLIIKCFLKLEIKSLNVLEAKSLAQILGYEGIAYSSPTLSSAITNLTSAFTFSLAVFLLTLQLIFHKLMLLIVFLYDSSATIIAVPICFIGEANLSAWRPSADIAIAAIIYKGPFYVASFKPLSIAIAADMAFIFLGDALYLGSEGKNEEDSSIVAIDSKSKTPLLQSIKAEGT